MRIRVGFGIALILVLALTGGAYAAGKITGAQIKDGTITGKDVKDRSLSAGKLSDSAMREMAGDTGPAGPAGPAGSAGPQGPAGPAGPSAVAKLAPTTGSFSVPGGTDPNTSILVMTVQCPAGQRVISGGWFSDNGIAFADKTYDGASWSVGIDNYGSSSSADGTLTALCTPAGVAVASSAKRGARDAKIASDVARRRSAH